MTPIRMPHTTRSLGAPRDWDESKHGPCAGLPITDRDGVMFSYRKPTWRERAAVAFGKPVRLSVVGISHPPVCVDVQP